MRVVGNRWLKKILRRTGPVFSTSVNISGEPPITGPDQALQFLPHHLIVRDDFKAMTNQPSRIFNAITGKYLR